MRLNHYYEFKRKTASHTNVAYTVVRNSQRIAIQWFVLPNVQIFFVQKISFTTFGVSIDDFFTRYTGLGYSLHMTVFLQWQGKMFSLFLKKSIQGPIYCAK